MFMLLLQLKIIPFILRIQGILLIFNVKSNEGLSHPRILLITPSLMLRIFMRFSLFSLMKSVHAISLLIQQPSSFSQVEARIISEGVVMLT